MQEGKVGKVSCSSWNGCQKRSCCLAGCGQAHSDSPSLLHNAAAQPASFLFIFFFFFSFFFRRRQPKLREVCGSWAGEGILSLIAVTPTQGQSEKMPLVLSTTALPLLQHHATAARASTVPGFVLWKLAAHSIPAREKDHAAAEGCNIQRRVRQPQPLPHPFWGFLTQNHTVTMRWKCRVSPVGR